jgi:hypothetical protein
MLRLYKESSDRELVAVEAVRASRQAVIASDNQWVDSWSNELVASQQSSSEDMSEEAEERPLLGSIAKQQLVKT